MMDTSYSIPPRVWFCWFPHLLIQFRCRCSASIRKTLRSHSCWNVQHKWSVPDQSERSVSPTNQSAALVRFLTNRKALIVRVASQELRLAFGTLWTDQLVGGCQRFLVGIRPIRTQSSSQSNGEWGVLIGRRSIGRSNGQWGVLIGRELTNRRMSKVPCRNPTNRNAEFLAAVKRKFPIDRGRRCIWIRLVEVMDNGAF